jgi:hypothetical protein
MKMASSAAEARIAELEWVVKMLRERLALQRKMLEDVMQAKKARVAVGDVQLSLENARLREEVARLKARLSDAP